MNSVEIERFLQLRCGDKFQGVFSSDMLPPKPRLLVCNTDPHYKPGTHWIAICVDGQGRGEFFDSFGQMPMPLFREYMNKHCRVWTFNGKQLQSILSSFCGHYCCFYCVYRCREVNMAKIVSQFTSDTAFNDVLAHAFVCNQ